MSNSHMRINNDFMRTPEFLEFINRCHGTNYYFILSGVVRDLNGAVDFSTGMNYIYKQHYLKGELVARYGQMDMAEYLKTDQSRISKNVKKLEELGTIKKIYKRTPKGRALYYQVGVWEGILGDRKTYTEHLFGDEIFRGYARVAKQKRGDKNPSIVSDSLADFADRVLDPTHPEYGRLTNDWTCKL